MNLSMGLVISSSLSVTIKSVCLVVAKLQQLVVAQAVATEVEVAVAVAAVAAAVLWTTMAKQFRYLPQTRQFR